MSLISEYFARVGADVDEESLKEVDKFLSQIEKKLNKLNNNVKIADTVKKSISQTAQEIKGVKTVKAKADALTKEATAQKALNKQKAEEAKQVAKVAKATKALTASEKALLQEEKRRDRLRKKAHPAATTAARSADKGHPYSLWGKSLSKTDIKEAVKANRVSNRLKPIGGLDSRIGHLFPDKGMSATARNRLAKEYESAFALPYASAPKSLLESRLAHLQPNTNPTTKTAYKRTQEELQKVFNGAVDNNTTLKPIGNLDKRLEHLFPSKRESISTINKLAKEYEDTFKLPYAKTPKGVLDSRLAHLKPEVKPTTKAAYKRRQEELQGVFGSLVKSTPTIHQRKDVSASQASRNRATFFATEAAVIKGIKDGDREGFIKKETEARKNQIKTTNQLIKAEQRLADIQKRKEMSSEIKRRVASRVAAHEAESSGIRAVLARQEAQLKDLNERYKELMSAKPKRGGVGSFATGLGAGSVLRSGLPALPMVGGAFGFVSANKFSQEVALAPMTTMAAFEAQGRTSAEAQQSWEWYKQLSNKVGANYMDSAQDFNSFMANALGSGINIEDSQNIFKGFSEYQTAMGLTPYRRKLVNAALTQMLGKGTVSTEELNNRFL